MANHSTFENITARELPCDFSMLEIGVGSHPFSPQPTVLVNNRMKPNKAFSFEGEKRYLGVDNGRTPTDHDISYLGSKELNAAKAAEKLLDFTVQIREVRPGENIELYFGEIADLGIQPRSVSEVLMCNVLSSGLSDMEKRFLVRAAADLITPKGLLVIRETFTPHFNSPEELLPRLQILGFDPIEIISASEKPEQLDELTNYYGPTIHDMDLGYPLNPERYFCLAMRP
jgi:hypothetical protein